MDNEELKRKIFNYEKFRRLEEKTNLAQRKLDETADEARKREAELFRDIAKFIKNFLEGKTLEGRKIQFDSDKQRTAWEVPDWWIYSFKLEVNNILVVVLAENTDNGPNFHVISCNLDNKKVFYKDKLIS